MFLGSLTPAARSPSRTTWCEDDFGVSGQGGGIKDRFPEFAKYGSKFDKAVDTVLSRGVKECRFLQSGRKVLVVVGRFGDELVDPQKPYCSCANFYFKVIRGKDDLCYHLISYRIASKTGLLDVLEFYDEEYGPYFSATVDDIMNSLEREEE